MDNQVTETNETVTEAAPPIREKVFHFQPRLEPAAETPPAERRDWGAALDLINEASEAVRWAEERAQTAEDYSKQLAIFHKEQLKAADQRVANADKRAEAALQRATEAEAWLTRFHDAIVEGFGYGARESDASRAARQTSAG